MKYWIWVRELITNHTGVVIAAVVGFAVGAGGFAAAQRADDAPSLSDVPAAIAADTTASPTSTNPATSTMPSTTAVVTTSVPTTNESTTSSPGTTVDSGTNSSTSTSVVGSDDSTTTSVDDDDDATSTTIDDDDDVTSTTIDDDDDATSTTIDDDDDATSTTIDDDDDATSTTIDDGDDDLAPFTQTYSSSGGSVTVTWTGTQLLIDAVSPVAGFQAEIEDQSHDRVRVDFEHDDLDDARVEVRVDDGRLRVDID